jgi:sulfur carrier protein ThiS
LTFSSFFPGQIAGQTESVARTPSGCRIRCPESLFELLIGGEREMKVRAKLWGIPTIDRPPKYEKEIQLEFDGRTVKDLIQHLLSEIEPKSRNFVVDEKGEISSELAILINGKIVSESNRYNKPLTGGDFIELVLAPG